MTASSLFKNWLLAACACALCLCAAGRPTLAQSSNPVERKVENPITDTPNVNPLTQDQQPILPRRRTPQTTADGTATTQTQPTDTLTVDADRQTVTGEERARVAVYEGNVDIHIGIYRLQADKVTVYEATNKVIAEGSVVFDQGDSQRITGTRSEWNYATKLGYFVNSTGFTNQTQDGTIIYFTAERVEKVAANKVVVLRGEVTACDEERPKWSFRSKRAVITLNDRVRTRSPTMNVKGLPVLYMPYASISIKRRDRASGFLTPTFSGSGKKGFRLSNAYYQTLGRSADITLRNDIFTGRGLGFGADLRTKANTRSYLHMGFYAVKDRLFGAKADDNNPDQGGSSFYVDGVHYFPNGFMAAADVNVTSNLAFRQIFSDSIQLAISPEERSQVFVNKNHEDYSFNFLARTQVISIPNVRIRTRQMPSVSFDKRPSLLSFFKSLPLYFSFESSIEGMSRKETVEDLGAFRAEGTPNAIITPSIVQRLDIHPNVSLPLELGGGWRATATAGVRATYYSNSLDPLTRLVTSRDLVRGYGEFEFDVRPPALARNFRRDDGSMLFRHTVEPYFIYRKLTGVNAFHRVIRFDEKDAIADTNEIEYGLTNRFFIRRSTENVSGKPNGNGKTGGEKDPSKAGEKGMTGEKDVMGEKDATGEKALTGDDGDESRRDAASEEGQATRAPRAGESLRPLSPQPFEILSITLRQKYFFDRSFGGALIPGQRNQFYPLNTFSGFTYGGVPRRFSPLYVEGRLRRPVKWGQELYADVRTNLDVIGQGGGLRDLAVSFGFRNPVRFVRVIEAFQTFYYTRAVTLAPDLRRFSNAAGNEPGTLQGSQWSPSSFLGDRDGGLFGGISFFFDFQNRPGRGTSSLISSTTTVGYTWDCCAITGQYFTFNVGLRQERRAVFSFRLNGIGTFGTEQIGQHIR